VVFINCCFLGKISEDEQNWEEKQKAQQYPRHEFAASLSQKLIEMGVKVVVAAGWAVDDTAAITFAETFYSHMLGGTAFGDAVTQARKETYDLHGDRTNTWGAYQAYGDPAYRIKKSSGSGDRDSRKIFVDLEEALVEIDNLTKEAKTTSVQELGYLREKLNIIVERIDTSNKTWFEDAALNEKFGEAFGEVDLFEDAVTHYETALAHNKNRASIRMTEQLANLRVRSAIELHNKGQQDQALVNITKSIEQVKNLNKAFGESTERFSIIGSAYKRQAQISQEKARQNALQKMETYYQKAWNIGENNGYPLGNWLTTQGVLYWIGVYQRKSREWETNLAKLDELAKREKVANPHNFWAAIGETDSLLARYVLTGDYGKEKEDYELAELYLDSWRRYGTARELGSILEHLAFLVEMFGPQDVEFEHDSNIRKGKRAEFNTELRSIATRLIETVNKKP